MTVEYRFCLKCTTKTTQIHADRIHGERTNKLAFPVPKGRIFGIRKHPKAYVCLTCGYVEMYVSKSDIEHLRKAYT